LPLGEGFPEAVGTLASTILTIEDNYAGGLGSAVAELAATCTKTRAFMMTPKRLPKSGRTADDVLAYVGLSRDDIVAKCLEILG
jgi:transketolase